MKMKPPRDGIALCHVVLAHEDFEKSAFNLFRLIRNAQDKCPGQMRILYLDVEGHRNGAGEFDQDMLELQTDFTTEFLLQFLSRVVMPLATIENPNPQKNDLPDELILYSNDTELGGGSAALTASDSQ